MNKGRPSFSPALGKLDFHFLSNLIGYDRGDGCPFDFEPNEIPFTVSILKPYRFMIIGIKYLILK